MTSLRIAITGLGTVGVGVLDLLRDQKVLLEAKSFSTFDLVAVSARNREKSRGDHDLTQVAWYADPITLAKEAEYDVLIELIGGKDDPAYSTVRSALGRGKHVITANKALISDKGLELGRIADSNKVALHFEAAVGGGMPIIKCLRESLSGETIQAITGILNGTCNFILTQMLQESCTFQDALKKAQELGYAEQDPSFDIQGFDTAHKLSILSVFAFGIPPALPQTPIQGIEEITREDIELTSELGYTLKLLGHAYREGESIEQSVGPYLVPQKSILSSIYGAQNAVFIEGKDGKIFSVMGPGAGAHPTALAILSDLCDIARGNVFPTFGVDIAALHAAKGNAPEERSAVYYVGFHLRHDPKAREIIERLFEAEGLFLEEGVQHAADRNTRIRCGFLVRTPSTLALINALDALRTSGYVLGGIKQIPVLKRG